MKKLLIGILVMLFLSTLLPVLAQDEAPPDEVLAERPGFFPEGIEYDEENAYFLLGSLTEGTVFTVADDGTVTPLVEDEDLTQSVGIHLDEATDRLLVAVGDPSAFFDPSVEGIAAFGAYDRTTGERLLWVDLAQLAPDGRHFANDVTVDDEGNAYVTDTFTPIIYKVDPEGLATIFLQDERFASEQGGLNGIEFHADGYLLVSVIGTSSIYKIPLDNPEEMTEVELDRPISGDGLILHPDGDLIVVGSYMGEDDTPVSAVVKLHSEDDWATATTVGSVDLERQASTAAIRGEDVYIIFPGFEAMGSEDVPETSQIMRVQFEEMAE
jgi:hypothetical protein